MATVETLPHVEPAPPGPDLPGQLVAFQRKAERHKAALAKLEHTLARTKRQLREKAEDCAFATDGVALALQLLVQEQSTEATVILAEVQQGLRGDMEWRTRLLARARTRDHTLLTLRAKVKQLHSALSLARALLQTFGSEGLRSSSPGMQEIQRALSG